MSSTDLKKSKRLKNSLLKKLAEGPERGGFVLRSGKIVEIPNIHEDPENGFVSGVTETHIALLSDIAATWHTHPGATANLSVGDSETFCAWPDLLHIIVGTDGVRWYSVKNGAVVNAA